MYIKEIEYQKENALELEKFIEMDYSVVNKFDLPIELMMENAGLQMANLIAKFASKDKTIRIGAGKGNNGGGGLVAARRLSAWGFKVYLDLPFENYNDLANLQLKRALKFGAKIELHTSPDVWVDAYLGFSQRLPISPSLLKIINDANKSTALKIALDIPTGFFGEINSSYFQAEKILTLAAPKNILFNLKDEIEIFVADIGIPKFIYNKFNVSPLSFDESNIIKIKRL
jgi:NAD(P)H-hydrate epimerase